MKKIIIVFCFSILLIGCGKYSVRDAEKDLEKKINNLKGYSLFGEMEIKSNDDSYKYDVDVSYSKPDKYRVSLKNKTNNHEQIILKNDEGVYVLTPSLNKSFKFQSDWPYNNSQVYLLQTLLSDIQNDSSKKFIHDGSNYVFITKVNYPNNTDLVNQKIYFDEKLNPVKVVVFNENGDELIIMKFSKVDLRARFKDNKFSLDNNMKVSKNIDDVMSVSKIDSDIYPMYLPKNTKLGSKEKIDLENGQRIIMNFEGDKPFMLVEQTVSSNSDDFVISVDGNPYLMATGIASVSDNMVSWINNGIEYYVVSDVLKDDELLSVANSVSVMPTGK